MVLTDPSLDAKLFQIGLEDVVPNIYNPRKTLSTTKYLYCQTLSLPRRIVPSEALVSSDAKMSLLLYITPVVAYACTVALSRLYYHALSKFPGPPLAAITSLYEFYYDAVLGGQYLKKFPELHRKHGMAFSMAKTAPYYGTYLTWNRSDHSHQS